MLRSVATSVATWSRSSGSVRLVREGKGGNQRDEQETRRGAMAAALGPAIGVGQQQTQA